MVKMGRLEVLAEHAHFCKICEKGGMPSDSRSRLSLFYAFSRGGTFVKCFGRCISHGCLAVCSFGH